MASNGLAEAQYSYGIILQKKKLDVDAFEWLHRAASEGHLLACHEIATCYNEGKGVQKNQNIALTWHRYAADLGEVSSSKFLENYFKDKGIAGSFTAWYDNLPLPDNKSIIPSKSNTIIKVDNSIDVNIPVSQTKSPNTFVVCIANENYNAVQNVPYALNDARIFSEYCRKTLGIPTQNIRKYEDASLGNMISALSDIKMISESYDGDINFIIYYSGHGINNEKDSEAFLLPIDADGKNTDICFSLNKFYNLLGQLNAKSVTVFIDACFSGSIRGDGMLVAARGIAIKPKENSPSGNMIVFSASQGDETALPFEEKGHGMFTYFILKKLKETTGGVSLGELADYVSTQVRQQSVVINRKPQTPKVSVSPSLSSSWRDIKLK